MKQKRLQVTVVRKATCKKGKELVLFSGIAVCGKIKAGVGRAYIFMSWDQTKLHVLEFSWEWNSICVGQLLQQTAGSPIILSAYQMNESLLYLGPYLVHKLLAHLASVRAAVCSCKVSKALGLAALFIVN